MCAFQVLMDNCTLFSVTPDGLDKQRMRERKKDNGRGILSSMSDGCHSSLVCWDTEKHQRHVLTHFLIRFFHHINWLQLEFTVIQCQVKCKLSERHWGGIFGQQEDRRIWIPFIWWCYWYIIPKCARVYTSTTTFHQVTGRLFIVSKVLMEVSHDPFNHGQFVAQAD